MRRKISLYIAGQPVDLDEQSFILFNYTMEEMSNPTIVRNSFSQSITLKGTPRNNKIFGNIYRSDRKTQYGNNYFGVQFDPARKTPFVIYNEINEILEEGYVKLDKVSKKGESIEYSVTLYGGLGSFLYGLSYDKEGNKKTLADLDFMGSLIPNEEFDFEITKDVVLEAWERLRGKSSASAKWDFINFAPAYNGLPGGTFDANKALVYAYNAGLKEEDGEFKSLNGYVLANLPNAVTEWETKDLRSYLQKPVLRIKGLIDALCKSSNNGGYQVELDENFFNESNPYYNDTWLTLPLLNTLNIDIQETSWSLVPEEDVNIDLYNGGNISANYIINLNLSPTILVAGSPSGDLYLHSYEKTYEDSSDGASAERDSYYANYIEYTLSAYDSYGSLLTRQKVKVASRDIPNEDINIIGHFDSAGNWVGADVSIYLEAMGVSYVRLTKEIKSVSWGYAIQSLDSNLVWTDTENYASKVKVLSWSQEYYGSTYTYKTSAVARSGARINKVSLLSTSSTPADYLLSYCKMFGLHIMLEKGTRKVKILSRKTLYRNEIFDLTERINIGEDIQKKPFFFDSKWYDFGVKYEKGEKAEYYTNVHSAKYGVQKVNTGYEFNSDTKEVLDNIVFRGAVETLENSKFYLDLTENGFYIPSVFIESGSTYTLKKANGEEQEYPIPAHSSAEKSWLNEENKTYDLFSKAQFHEKENKPYEERDTLLILRGIKNISEESARYAVTDDTSIMMLLNENTPCWLLDYQLVDSSCRITHMPMFSRYAWDEDDITHSLDFGTPAELFIPKAFISEESSIYSQYWEKYINDRYDDDSKVMTCKVNLSGLQVNEELFRRFYYYDGAIWALNKINNHSLTTWDDTECEFIKVQDINNYIG